MKEAQLALDHQVDMANVVADMAKAVITAPTGGEGGGAASPEPRLIDLRKSSIDPSNRQCCHRDNLGCR